VVASLPEALAAAGDAEIAFVIGGAELYRQALPWPTACSSPRSTRTTPATPSSPTSTARLARSQRARVAESGLPFAFVTYERRRKPGPKKTPRNPRRFLAQGSVPHAIHEVVDAPVLHFLHEAMHVGLEAREAFVELAGELQVAHHRRLKRSPGISSGMPGG
jgi:hypothetical protein